MAEIISAAAAVSATALTPAVVNTADKSPRVYSGKAAIYEGAKLNTTRFPLSIAAIIFGS